MALSTWLPSVLHQGIVGVLSTKGDEVGVVEVEVVDATHKGGHVFLFESFGEGADQRRLAGTLDSVEAYHKGLGAIVGLEELEDEGDADGRFVVLE